MTGSAGPHLRVLLCAALAAACSAGAGQPRRLLVSTEQASGPAAAAAAVAFAAPAPFPPLLDGIVPTPPGAAFAPTAGVSAWVQPQGAQAGLNAFGVWSPGRLFQLLIAVFLMVLVAYFIIVSSRHLVQNWEQETQSQDWRPFATAGKQYGTVAGVGARDDNPWREGSEVNLAAREQPLRYQPVAAASPPPVQLASTQRAPQPSAAAAKQYQNLPNWA